MSDLVWSKTAQSHCLQRVQDPVQGVEKAAFAHDPKTALLYFLCLIMTSSTGSIFGSSKKVQSRWNKNAQRKTDKEACPGMQVATECCFHLWHVPRQPRTLMERVFAVRGPLGVRHSGKSINPSANRYWRTDLTVALYPGYLHAKSLQLCPTLAILMNCSPPGSSVHGDSPGKNTGVGCHALLQEIFPTKGMLQSMRLQSQTRLSNWTELTWGIKPRSSALQVDSSPSEPPEKPENTGVGSVSLLQGSFLTHKSNWGLLFGRRILYQLS